MKAPRGLLRALCCQAALFLAVSPALANEPSSVDLPAGTLGRAMITLSRQANENIGTTDPALSLRPVSAVRGWLTTRQALDRLLAHSDAVALPIGPRNWRIVRRQAVATPAPAPVRQTAPDPEPEPATIMVVGKRAMRLWDFPGTAIVLSADALAPGGGPAGTDAIENHLSSIDSTHFGSGRDRIFVRGIADSGFTGPSQSTTGQYLDDTRLTYNAPDPNLRLYDIARVEVLEGPQGALYGAGSLGGVLRVATISPQLDRFSARASGGVATTAHGAPSFDLAGVVNLPLLTDSAALRVVGYTMEDGGYIDDPVRGRKDINTVRTQGGRAGLRLAPGNWTVDLDAVWQGIRGEDSQWTAGGTPLERLAGGPLGYRSDFILGSLNLARRWDTLDLTSTTSATHQYLLQNYDATSGETPPVTARQIDRITLFANETRLSRRGKDGTGWMVGMSLLHNRSVLDRLTTDSAGGTTPHQYAVNSVWEETLFGEAGFRLPAGLLLTTGVRLTNARTHGNATAFIETTTIPIFGSPVSGSGGERKFRLIPTVALSYHPMDAALLFLRYQQGFRPGGFGISNAHAREYSGDRMSTVEAGMRLGDGAQPLQFFATASYSRWTNILAEVVTLSGDPITQNIGDGRIIALEARAAWRPVMHLSFDASLFVNRSRLYRPSVSSIIVAHNALPNVARFSAQGGFEYSLPLPHDTTLSVTGNGRYFGGSHVGAGPVLDAAQGDYFNSDLLLSLARGARALSLSVSNPFDARGNRFALGTPYRIYDSQATPLRPRTIRLGLDVRL